ncbi:MAG: hypothetical protein ABSF83_15765, partial [Nitrososphaerales archaeon]
VFISEEPAQTTLGYLVDAVVEFRRELREGAVVRTLEVQKLRGSPILRPESLYTLAGARFMELEPDHPRPIELLKKKEDFKPIKHSKYTYSSGTGVLDEGFAGGFRKGSVTLLEFGQDLNPAVHYGGFNIIFANFIMNGGCAMTIPGGGASIGEIVALAKLAMPAEAVSERFIVGAFEKYDSPNIFLLSPTSIRDCFDTVSAKVAAVKGKANRAIVGLISVDVLESIFEERELLYFLSRMMQNVRRNQDILALKCGYSSTLKAKLADLCDVHVKYETISEAHTIHGINPPGPFMHVMYDYSRGYPYPVFTPIL